MCTITLTITKIQVDVTNHLKCVVTEMVFLDVSEVSTHTSLTAVYDNMVLQPSLDPKIVGCMTYYPEH